MARGALLRFSLFALVSLALTVAIGATILGTSFDDRIELTAQVDDVGGLRAGDDVRLAGVRVGSVLDLTVEQGRAVIRFTVDEDVALPTDSSARVQWVDLIGQNELRLDPGEATSTLAHGDEVAATTSATDLAELADAFGPLTQTLDAERINELTATVLTILDGREGDLSRLLVDLDAALATFTDREDAIDRLLDDYTVLADTVARREDQLTTLVDHLLVIAETFDDADELVESVIVRTGDTLTDVDALLAATADDLAAVLGDLTQVTATVVDDIDTLEAGIGVLPDGMDAVLRATSHGDAVALEATCTALTPPPCPASDNPFTTGSLRGAGPDGWQRLLLPGREDG